jgi:hypothetical protein
VIGQAKFGTRNSACTAKGLNAPETISVGGGHLVVADSSNARVLIYNKIPTKDGAKANIVLGQNNFKTCVTLNNGSGSSGAPSAANFSLSGRGMEPTGRELSSPTRTRAGC